MDNSGLGNPEMDSPGMDNPGMDNLGMGNPAGVDSLVGLYPYPELVVEVTVHFGQMVI